MTGDRELGIDYLSTYYQAAGLQFSGITFDQLTQTYDQLSPNFIEQFGGAIRNARGSLSEGEVREALSTVANDNAGRLPDYRVFIPALEQEIGDFKAGVIGHVSVGALGNLLGGPIGEAIGAHIGEAGNLDHPTRVIAEETVSGVKAVFGGSLVIAVAALAAYVFLFSPRSLGRLSRA